MTPFELSLENDLNIEWQRFANDWLFKWHGMTYEGGATDVDDFRGGRIRYAGIKFGGQQQQIFWQAIERYLLLKVHEIFKRWDAETDRYSNAIRLASLDGVERNLRQFVHRIIRHSLDTDRRLRGMGYPENVTHFDSAGQMSKAEAEIVRLGEAHRALLSESVKNDSAIPALSRKQRAENFLTNHRGILSLIGISVAISFGLLKVFLG
jgi:hypothetical protein